MTSASPISRRVWFALVFGNGSQIAWLLCCFAIWAPALAGDQMHYDFLHFAGDTAITTGTVTDVVEHKVKSKYGQQIVYEHHFSFVLDNVEQTGVSYGREHQGPKVDVQYLPTDHSRARIVGMSTRRASGVLAIGGIALFLLAAAVSLWRVLRVTQMAASLRAQLSQMPSYQAVGTFPKIRLDQSNELVTWNSAPIMVAPVAATALLLLLLLSAL